MPTLAESGYPNFRLTLWYAVTGPKGMAQDVIDILNREIQAALATADLRDRLTSGATDPVGSTPDQWRTFTSDEVTKWSPVVK